jgi:hypothetical protein
MSTQYRLVQSGKTVSGGCSAGQGSSEPVAPRIIFTIRHYEGRRDLGMNEGHQFLVHDDAVDLLDANINIILKNTDYLLDARKEVN